MQTPTYTKNLGGASEPGENNKEDAVALMHFERPEHAERAVVDHTLTGVRAFRQAVVDLIPDVRMRADAAEKERRVPAETMASLRKAGLFRAFVPRVYGGDERTLAEVLDATTDLAAGCPSTAWVGTLFAFHNIAACWLEKRGQDEIFAEGPDVLVASSVAPMGTLVPAEGGFRLEGRWAFASGVEHASWVMVGANLESESANTPAEYVFCFVRASEVTLIDDWHVSGLRATGSKSLELKGIFGSASPRSHSADGARRNGTGPRRSQTTLLPTAVVSRFHLRVPRAGLGNGHGDARRFPQLHRLARRRLFGSRLPDHYRVGGAHGRGSGGDRCCSLGFPA